MPSKESFEPKKTDVILELTDIIFLHSMVRNLHEHEKHDIPLLNYVERLAFKMEQIIDFAENKELVKQMNYKPIKIKNNETTS